MRPRDNQRQRVYDAENAAHRQHSPATYWKQSVPNADLQSWYDRVLARPAIRNRWPHAKVRVTLGRGGGHEHFGTITLGVSGRNEWVMLHELAHHLTPDRYAAHGPEFAGVYLFLVKTVLGAEAHTALLAAMRAGKVRRSNAAVPAPRSRTEMDLIRKVSEAEATLRAARMALDLARRDLANYQAEQRPIGRAA